MRVVGMTALSPAARRPWPPTLMLIAFGLGIVALAACGPTANPGSLSGTDPTATATTATAAASPTADGATPGVTPAPTATSAAPTPTPTPVSQPQPTPTPTTAPPTPGFLVASPQVQTVAAISDAHTYLSNTGGSPLNWRTEGFENRTPDCPSAAPSPTSGVLQPGQQVTIGYSGACPTVPQQPTCLRIHWIADATGQELQTLICGTG